MKLVKDYTYCILSERILLFSVSEFAYDLTISCIDFLYEWNLLVDNKLSSNVRSLNEYMLSILEETKEILDLLSKQKNMKIYFIDNEIDLNILSPYIDDSEKFQKKVKRFCKKILIGKKSLPFIERKNFYNFINFDDLICINLEGKQLEKLIKKIVKD